MHIHFRNRSIAVILASFLLALPAAGSAAESAPDAKSVAVVPSAATGAAPVATAAPAIPAAPAPVTAPEPKAAVAAPGTAPTQAAPVPPAPPAPTAEKPQTLQQPAAAVRIGFVDLSRIGQESKQGKKAQAQVKSRKDKLQNQITAKQKQLEKQKTSIQEKLQTMAPAERAAKTKEFEKKVEEYRKFVQKAENEMKQLQEQATRTLFQDIQTAAAAYGKANDFTAILTLKDILYLGTGTLPEDVTTAVLKQMGSK